MCRMPRIRQLAIHQSLNRPSLKTVALCCLLFFTGLSHAGMNVEFDRDRIEAGQEFRMFLVIPLQELPPDHGLPEITDLQGFDLKGVDSVDEKINTFFTGRMTVRKFRYTLVAPKVNGAYSLPMVWNVGGQQRSIGKIRIDVARSMDAPGLQVLLTPNKQNIYEGEQLTLTMTLLTYENFQGGLNLGSVDLGNDFVAHRADLSKLSFGRSQRPGVQSEVSAPIAWLAPIRSGSLEVPELKFKYQKMGAPKMVNKQMGNFSFSSMTQGTEEATALSGKVRFKVQPLPLEGQPPQFSGLVGQYSFDAKVDKTQLQVGEALSMVITIRGNGKPGSIPDPVLPSFSEFRSVPPEADLQKTIENGQVWTKRTLKVFLYPKKKGSFTIPAFSYNWFDPKAKKYVVVESPTWQIQVEKGEITEAAATGGGAPMVYAGAEKRAIEQLGQDIRFIHEPSRIQNQSLRLYKSVLWWILLILPFLILIAFRMWYGRYLANRSNRAYVRRERAMRILQERLIEIRQLVANKEMRQFYAKLESLLIVFLGDLYNTELQGLTRQDLSANLAQHKVPAEDIARILQWLEDGDRARFAPIAVSEQDTMAILDQVQAMCNRLGRIVS